MDWEGLQTHRCLKVAKGNLEFLPALPTRSTTPDLCSAGNELGALAY